MMLTIPYEMSATPPETPAIELVTTMEPPGLFFSAERLLIPWPA